MLPDHCWWRRSHPADGLSQANSRVVVVLQTNVRDIEWSRQELSSILLRLLKVDLEECLMRELKTLYCSLLTAWHAEAGQVEALNALAAHIRKLCEA
eukprot:g28130.t1